MARGKNQQGAALIWVTLFCGVLVIMITNMLLMSQKELRLTTDSDISYKAYVAAQSGLDLVLYDVRKQIRDSGVDSLPATYASSPPTIQWAADTSNDSQDTTVNTGWNITYDAADADHLKPKINMWSESIVEYGGKTARRRLEVVHDYSQDAGSETFQDRSFNLNAADFGGMKSVNGELSGSINAVILIDIVESENPIRLSDKLSGTPIAEPRPNFTLNLNYGGDTTSIGFGTDVLYPSEAMDFVNYNYRWRINYVASSKVSVVLEQTEKTPDPNIGKRWTCARDGYFTSSLASCGTGNYCQRFFNLTPSSQAKSDNQLTGVSIVTGGHELVEENGNVYMQLNDGSGNIDNIVAFNRGN